MPMDQEIHGPAAYADKGGDYACSDSFAAVRATPGNGSGRSTSPRMSKRLLFTLLSAAFAAALLVGLTVPATPAQAELRTVTVRLADGSLTTVTVDVPPGTPLSDIPLPGTPLTDLTTPTPAPTPTGTTPAPTPTTPSSPAPMPSGGGGGGSGGGGSVDQGKPGGGSPTVKVPNASDRGAVQKTTGDAKKA